MNVKLITDIKELKGTCYFEFLPGKYQQKCWNEKSVYIEDLVFDFLYPAFEESIPEFDYYSFVPFNENDFQLLYESLQNLKVTPLPYDVNHDEFLKLIDDLTDWIQKQFFEFNVITILGM